MGSEKALIIIIETISFIRNYINILGGTSNVVMKSNYNFVMHAIFFYGFRRTGF